MSAARARRSAAARAVVLGCLVGVLVAGSGVCQTGEPKVTIVTTGPLLYTVNQQGSLVRDEAALPGAQVGLQSVDANEIPDTSAVAYDVTLLDLARPRGALEATQEGPPIILTPARLAELRRRGQLEELPQQAPLRQLPWPSLPGTGPAHHGRAGLGLPARGGAPSGLAGRCSGALGFASRGPLALRAAVGRLTQEVGQ